MPQAIIQGPTRTPVPYGLFSVLTFPTGAGERWQMGAGWEGATCGLLNGLGPLECEAPDPETGDSNVEGVPREFAVTRDWSEAETFAVYGSFQCAPVGYDVGDAQTKAGEDLAWHEEATVEDIIWHGHYGQFALNSVTPFGDFGVEEAVAELEHRAAREYGVQGVIHMPRRLALMAEGVLDMRNNRLTTKFGTPVVAGSGYGVEDNLIVVTPPMVSRRGEILSLGDPMQNFDRGQNLVTTVAERDYLIGYDTCEPFAAGITL